MAGLVQDTLDDDGGVAGVVEDGEMKARQDGAPEVGVVPGRARLAKGGKGREPIEDVAEFGKKALAGGRVDLVEVGGVLIDVVLRTRADDEAEGHARWRGGFLARARRCRSSAA